MRVLFGLSNYCTVGRILLAGIMVFAGAEHFLHTDLFAGIVPEYIPGHRLVVQISGFFEIAGGVGLLVPKIAPWAALGLMLLLIAVFPANVGMALANTPIGGRHYPVLLWLRLPLQVPLILWAYQYTAHRAATMERTGI